MPSQQMPMATGISLGRFLVGMLLGQGSCGRVAVGGQLDDWSVTVDELLRVTLSQTINSPTRPWAHGQPKQIFVPLFGVQVVDMGANNSLQVVAVDPPPPDGGEAPTDPSPERGISILRIAISRLEREG
jgi:hypothetical protein